MKKIKEYVSIPFKGKELKTDSILDAEEHIRNQFTGNKVYFNPVCAFGITYSAYIDNDARKENRDWELINPCGIIIYGNEDNKETRERVARRKSEYNPSKFL
jgi:hypothetical protein